MADDNNDAIPVVTIQANIVLEPFTATMTARVRHNFALQHLLAAARTSRNVGEIERANAGKEFGEFFEEMIGYSVACVTSAVAGLEAYVNELFADRAKYMASVQAEIADRLWELSEQRSILDKFDSALVALGSPQLDRGIRPTQDVVALVRLRNGLVHFKPEWDDERRAHATLSDLLIGKFSGSPYHKNEGLFPVRWICHEATRWAVNSATLFIADFESRAKIEPRWDHKQTRLQP